MSKFSLSTTATPATSTTTTTLQLKQSSNPLIEGKVQFNLDSTNKTISKTEGPNQESIFKKEFSLSAKPELQAIPQQPIQQPVQQNFQPKPASQNEIQKLLNSAENQIEITRDQCKEDKIEESQYKVNRSKYLNSIIGKNFQEDRKDSLNEQIFSPMTLFKWQEKNIQKCEEENNSLVNINVLMEFVKKLSKKPNQRLDVFKNMQIDFPFPIKYEDLPEIIISGDINSELAMLQLDQNFMDQCKNSFIQLQINIQEVLNKFTAQNLTSASEQIVLAILTARRDDFMMKVPKAILYYVLDQIILKAGLEKNFIQLYVDLINQIHNNSNIIEFIMDIEHDFQIFQAKITGMANITESKEIQWKQQYAGIIFKQLIKLNIDSQLNAFSPTSKILKILPSDVQETITYKNELQHLYFINLYKFIALLTIEGSVDAGFAETIFETLINKASVDVKQVKMVCDSILVLLGEITWYIDLQFLAKYRYASGHTDEAKFFADTYLADSEYHYGYLSDFLNGKEKVFEKVDKKLFVLFNLKQKVYALYLAKISQIKVNDALTAYNIREVQYGHDEKFVKTSLHHTKYQIQKKNMKRTVQTIIVSNTQRKQITVTLTPENWSRFSEILAEGTMMEAIKETFQLDDAGIKLVSWAAPLQQLTQFVLSGASQITQNVKKLIKFCDHQPQRKAMQQIVLSEAVQNEEHRELIIQALGNGFVSLADYVKFVANLTPTEQLKAFVNGTFAQLTAEDTEEDISSYEMFLQIAKKCDSRAIFDGLLAINDVSATVENAFLLLKKHNLEALFVHYCAKIDTNSLLAEPNIQVYLQNSDFYINIILKISIENVVFMSKLASILLPKFSVVSQAAQLFWRENCNSDTSIVEFFGIVIENGLCSKQNVADWFRGLPAFGPMAAIRQNDVLKKFLE
ncbi:hypothetical protein SS50377_24257 [Spironucleus salmonicida]|uniref:Uncharacterized protein n=1 Tax=Spironucleus salmonicida TaxID=348837 RepID=V6M5T4_9EUKA|nr:hypothetical protein SS50377_24257 [Spironucleus salmonicida]|eukprot:EST48699.1 Hypothetical protein SS50377_11109 [Spironucleus salmonicida]